METEGLLPCSQEPATDPYPEPDESLPHIPNLINSKEQRFPAFYVNQEQFHFCFVTFPARTSSKYFVKVRPWSPPSPPLCQECSSSDAFRGAQYQTKDKTNTRRLFELIICY